MLNPFKFNREHPTTIHPRQKKSRVFIDCMSAAAQGKSEIVHLIFGVGLGEPQAGSLTISMLILCFFKQGHRGIQALSLNNKVFSKFY